MEASYRILASRASLCAGLPAVGALEYDLAALMKPEAKVGFA